LYELEQNIKKWISSTSAKERILKKEAKFKQSKTMKEQTKETLELQYANP